MYEATIECKNDLYKALKPEETKNKRFEMYIEKTKEGVKIHFAAKDATALKAITTSMTRLIETAEKINDR